MSRKIMWIILGIAGVTLLLACGSVAFFFFWRNATTNNFYNQRYYPIPTQATLPGSGSYLILAGQHYQGTTEDGSPRTGTERVSGAFFVDLAAPELTHWTGEEAASTQTPVQTFYLARGQLSIYADGTYSAEGVPDEMTDQFIASFPPKRSADGVWFVYTTIEPGGGSPPTWTLHVQRADGTDHQVAFEDPQYAIHGVAWVPGNEQLVVHAAEYLDDKQVDRINTLYTVNRDGSQLTQNYREVEGSTHTFDNLLVHPNGTILYSIRNQLFALNPTTQQPEMIYEMLPERWLSQLKVSPDGSKLSLLPKNGSESMMMVILDVTTTLPLTVEQERVIADAEQTSIASYLWLPDSQGIIYRGAPAEDCLNGVNWQRSSSWQLCNQRLVIQRFDDSDPQILIDQHIEPDLVGIYQP